MFGWFTAAPRRTLAWLAVLGIAMLAFGLYLQHVVGLNPCPMCIVQRYALIAVILIAGIASLFAARAAQRVGTLLLVLAAGFGAFVAARQSWLQLHPPETVNCGRDFYGMVENYPLRRAIPMIFKGSGDCAAVDWTFLGGSIANWSFVSFAAFCMVLLALLMARTRPGVAGRR